MAIKQITTGFPGQVGVKPKYIPILCDDSFATVTSANFLLPSKNQGYDINDGDMALVTYGTTPTTQFFTVSISGGVITLEPVAGDVTLPVVSGNFAVFTGTNGALDDLGYSPTDPTKVKVVMSNGTSVVGNMATFADTAGTILDAGARILAGTTTVFGGGSASHAFTVSGLTAGARGAVVSRALTNSVSIIKAVPTTDTLTVTWSADPGAATTVDYIYSTALLS